MKQVVPHKQRGPMTQSFATRKSLGQHFLHDQNVLARIAGLCLPASGLVEIGPGTGNLTRHLQALGVDVVGEAGERQAGLLHPVRADALVQASLARHQLQAELIRRLGQELADLHRARHADLDRRRYSTHVNFANRPP